MPHETVFRHVRRLPLIMAACFCAFLFAAHPANAGAADNINGWLWSGTVGWISMNCTNLGTCGAVDYGVTLDNKPGFPDRGDLKGYGWSENIGWICFGAACVGTAPEGVAPYAEYRGTFNGRTDELYGWAQVVNLGNDGWIALNCQTTNTCATSTFHVTLDAATGRFTKLSADDHWAWGANSDGTGIGWVDWSTAQTFWFPARLGAVRRPEGVYEPLAAGLAGTHLFTFTIRFLGFSAPADYYVDCRVSSPDGSSRLLKKKLTSSVFDGQENLDYELRVTDAVATNKLWYVEECRLAGYLTATNCVADAACAGGLCDTAAGKCRGVVDRATRRLPVFTHENAWTGLGADQDQYRSLKCHAGFPDNYFKNPSQCDFAGDASFSLSMRRGFPVEGDCGDGVDNDGNGQIDCADRYCKGISYRCRTPAPTSCTFGQAGDGVIDCSDPSYVAGDLCCTRQPAAPATPTRNHIVNGLECSYGDPNDGYFDCDCKASKFDTSPTDDCFAPGYQTGDLCCSTTSAVQNTGQ